MGRIINLGTGNLEWGGNERGLRKGRSVYEQPGTRVDGSCHSKEGSKEVKGICKGDKKSKGSAPYMYVNCMCVHKC